MSESKIYKGVANINGKNFNGYGYETENGIVFVSRDIENDKIIVSNSLKNGEDFSISYTETGASALLQMLMITFKEIEGARNED